MQLKGSLRELRLKIVCLVLILVPLLLFVNCGEMDEEEARERMVRKLKEVDSYKIEGKVFIGERGDKERNYNVKELYKSPDKIRLEIFETENKQKKQQGQIFISKDGTLEIYNPVIEEKYQLLGEVSMYHKFSFLFFEKLKFLDEDVEKYQFYKEGENYKFSLQDNVMIRELVLSEEEGVFGGDLVLEEVNLFKDSDFTDPYLTFSVDSFQWNLPLEEDVFEIERKPDQVEKAVDDEKACKIKDISTGEIAALEFDVLTLDHPDYEIMHIGVCEKSGHVSIKYSGLNENIAFTQVKDEEGDLEKDPQFIESDYDNVLKWQDENVKYKLIGRLSREDLLELRERTRNLEI